MKVMMIISMILFIPVTIFSFLVGFMSLETAISGNSSHILTIIVTGHANVTACIWIFGLGFLGSMFMIGNMCIYFNYYEDINRLNDARMEIEKERQNLTDAIYKLGEEVIKVKEGR